MTAVIVGALVLGAFAAGVVCGRRRAPAIGQVLDANRAVLESERARGNAELDGRKSLIDQQLAAMSGELRRVGTLVADIERDRRHSFGELANELQRQHEGLQTLNETTHQLRDALANPKVRGQWGERMADDVLRLAGFLEGVNYTKQTTLDRGGRPDFTFLLPNDLVLHMDVKFPLDNYVRHLEATSAPERAHYRVQFLRDVRERVKELMSRGYLDHDGGTVDCLLLFIPNEQVYAFVHENDPELLDLALRHKVVLCSPLTLYAVLAVVRQAVDNFRLERTSSEILRLLGTFSQQWERYAAQLDVVHKRFDAVAHDYTTLMTTRHRALQRPLDEIDLLRNAGTVADARSDPPLRLGA